MKVKQYLIFFLRCNKHDKILNSGLRSIKAWLLVLVNILIRSILINVISPVSSIRLPSALLPQLHISVNLSLGNAKKIFLKHKSFNFEIRNFNSTFKNQFILTLNRYYFLLWMITKLTLETCLSLILQILLYH